MGSPSAPGGYRRSGLGIELVRSVAEFEAAVGGPGNSRRDDLRTQLMGDFGFIAAYWLIFAATSTLLALRSFCAAPWLGALAGELGTAAALFDVQENMQTLQLLGADAAQGAKIIPRMRRASLCKWFCAFAATGVLSASFFERGDWFCILGAAYAAAAGLGVATLFLHFLQPRVGVSDRQVDRLLLAFLVWMGFVLVVGLPVGAAIA